MKPTQTSAQFIRYLFVGGFAAGLDAGCLYGLHHGLEIHYLVAAGVGFFLGLVANYLLSILWIFESSGNLRQEFPLFAAIGLGGLVWTELILWLVVTWFQAPLMVAKAIALFLVLIWNFGMRKKFVFGRIL